MSSLQDSDINSPAYEPEVEIYRPIPMHSAPESDERRPSRSWFASLSGGSKLLVIVLAGVVTLALVGVILQVIVWSIQLALIGILLFLAYRFFLHSHVSS
ncbi:MAG TPA: hypothetical protein ACFE0H_14285 [Elainellaceae cyanobacterium]